MTYLGFGAVKTPENPAKFGTRTEKTPQPAQTAEFLLSSPQKISLLNSILKVLSGPGSLTGPHGGSENMVGKPKTQYNPDTSHPG